MPRPSDNSRPNPPRRQQTRPQVTNPARERQQQQQSGPRGGLGQRLYEGLRGTVAGNALDAARQFNPGNTLGARLRDSLRGNQGNFRTQMMDDMATRTRPGGQGGINWPTPAGVAQQFGGRVANAFSPSGPTGYERFMNVPETGRGLFQMSGNAQAYGNRTPTGYERFMGNTFEPFEQYTRTTLPDTQQAMDLRDPYYGMSPEARRMVEFYSRPGAMRYTDQRTAQRNAALRNNPGNGAVYTFAPVLPSPTGGGAGGYGGYGYGDGGYGGGGGGGYTPELNRWYESMVSWSIGQPKSA